MRVAEHVIKHFNKINIFFKDNVPIDLHNQTTQGYYSKFAFRQEGQNLM